MAVSVPIISKMDPPKWTGTQAGRDLEDDLIRMGCARFYEKPWILSKSRAAFEILPREPPKGDIRAHPGGWTIEKWRDVYSLREEVWDYKVDKVLLESHVQGNYDLSECYHSSQFRGTRLVRVVEFLNSVLHPVRPERITTKLATAYVQAFYGLASPDWGVILVDCLRPLIARIRTNGGKKICLTSYLLHMYEHFEVLNPTEIAHWREVRAPQELAPRVAPLLSEVYVGKYSQLTL